MNDLLRKEIQALQARPELTADDKQRLDQHFATIRDTEIKISNVTMTDAQIAQMKTVDPKPYDTNNHEIIQNLHQDLMVFALSSGYTRVAVLQVGDREDDHEYTLNGVKTQFHTASHRTLPNSYELCKQIDRIHRIPSRRCLPEPTRLNIHWLDRAARHALSTSSAARPLQFAVQSASSRPQPAVLSMRQERQSVEGCCPAQMEAVQLDAQGPAHRHAPIASYLVEGTVPAHSLSRLPSGGVLACLQV